MRKRILILGGSLFQNIIYNDGNYILKNNQFNSILAKDYDIDNFSMENLTVTRALGIIKHINLKGVYSDCIVALGEYDLNENMNFNKEFNQLIDILYENDIRPVLVSLPLDKINDSRYLNIQNIIDNTAIEKNIDYIYEGKTDKIVSYQVLESNQLFNAILELC